MTRLRLIAGCLTLTVQVLCLLAIGLGRGVEAQSPSDMARTPHNLSVSGPGPVQALTETRICIFCHTPHNATPLSPLWNKELEPQVYTVYASPTLRAGPLPQPSGASKLCLSCHDGTIALGAVVNPVGGIGMASAALGSHSSFGLDLSGHHPVSFAYHNALPNPELALSPPPELVYGGADEVHCTTCHDPHSDRYEKFLLKDNRYSALCTSCHQLTGWSSSAHATSTASVVGILPRPPKTWPTYTQLNEWGCEACHTPHFAPTAEQLLNFTAAPPDPFSCTSAGCHSSAPGEPHATTARAAVGAPGRAAAGMVDIARQTRKPSAHHEPLGAFALALQLPGGAARSGVRSIACADCHNPHFTARGKAQAPYASGLLRAVSGVDRNGMEIRSVTYEYEVCFKCHGDNTPDLNYVPRVLAVTNTRRAFDAANPSYHPVVSMGRNLNIPSIPSPLEPSMSPSAMIYCTTCHADDEGGASGPHGSAFAPILKERYETADYTPESYDNYALCYRCHNRSSIMNDVSFRKKTMRTTASGGGHSGHLAAGAPCSACHDAHGVNEFGARQTGSHTHLINFDTRIVLPKAGLYPLFCDGDTATIDSGCPPAVGGVFSGSCTLVCHGVVHDGTSYP
ncbi:MAG: cytochrome c3 family protein [Deltaproteobacteria bacterium]|nr:cytochrome c3 family protein [Deltaproteobacteria bacterium]